MTSPPLPSPTFRSRSRRVLFAGFAGSFFSIGFSMYLFGVFQTAVLATFGGNVATFALASSLMSVISGVLSPFVGRYLATHSRPGVSIRTAMMVGAVAIGLGLLTISRTTSPLVAVGLFAFLVAPGTVMLGPLVTQAMITNWFDVSRGQKLGIVAAGTTIAGATVPVFAAWLIETLGWRDAMGVLSILMFVLPLPIAAIFARTTPEEVGEMPDGVDIEEPTPGRVSNATPLETRELMRLPAFWLCGVMFALQFSAGSVSVLFTIPYAEQLGLGLVAGAGILSLRSLFGALGKVVLSSLSDRIGVRPMIFWCFGSEIVLMTLMVQTRDPLWFSLYGIGLGFVGAAMLPLKGGLIAELFGRASFPSAFGLMQTIALPISPLMIPLAGYVKDQTGDYAIVFGGMIPLFAVACLLLVFIKPGSAVPRA